MCAPAAQFLEKGFDVVAVEASSALVQSASRRPVVSAALASGQLRIVSKAISRRPSNASVTFYVAIEGKAADYTNTFWLPEEEARAVRKRDSSRRYDAVQVPTVTCAELIEQFGVPEYIKVDIEGADRMCFESLTTRVKGGSDTAASAAAASGPPEDASLRRSHALRAGLDALLPAYASTENPELLDLFEQLGAALTRSSKRRQPFLDTRSLSYCETQAEDPSSRVFANDRLSNTAQAMPTSSSSTRRSRARATRSSAADTQRRPWRTCSTLRWTTSGLAG